MTLGYLGAVFGRLGLLGNSQQGWAPSELPNLKAWYRADSGVTVSGGLVSAWADRSGNGLTLTESIDANKPLYDATIFNGSPGIVFNGNQKITTGTNAFTGLNANNKHSWFFLIKFNSSFFPDYSRIAAFLASGASSDYSDATSFVPALVRNLSPLRIDTYQGGNPYAEIANVSMPYVRVAVIYDGTNITTYLNNVQVAQSAKSFSIASAGTLRLGGSWEPAGDYIAATVAEVIVTDNAENSSVRGQIDNYFKSHWGVDETTTLPDLYLWSTFENSNEQLYLLTSWNGTYGWRSRTCSYTPTPGHAVRDPYLLNRIADTGKLFLAHTAIGGFTNPSTFFDIATSTDGHTFTFQQSVDCSAVVSGATAAVWSPTWFVDDDNSVHIFFNASNTGTLHTNFQLYEVHPTNANMTTWSTPVVVTGTSLPANMIGPFMVKIGSTYHLWYKNETTDYVEYISSSSLTSGYTVTKSGNWASWGPMEGQQLEHRGGSSWRIYIDDTGSGIYFSDSRDAWATWSSRTLINVTGLSPVNGSIIPLPDGF